MERIAQVRPTLGPFAIAACLLIAAVVLSAVGVRTVARPVERPADITEVVYEGDHCRLVLSVCADISIVTNAAVTDGGVTSVRPAGLLQAAWTVTTSRPQEAVVRQPAPPPRTV